jgi:dihydroorotase
MSERIEGTILIQGGTVIDPASERNGVFDVLIVDGRIAEVAAPGALSTNGERIDATGKWVVPGLIDMHVHLREPGYEYKETIATGTKAAVVGGVTAVACMANTDPVNDNGAVTEYILERAAEANLARVYPIGAVSAGLRGQALAEIGEMQRAGIVAVSDDGHPVADSGLMRRALEYCSMLGLPVIVHEEDPGLAGSGVMNEGHVSFRLGLSGIPMAAEDVMVARDIMVLERTGGRLHIAHVSTARSVELIRAAKAHGLAVTAEVTPHHFTLTDEAVEGYDTNAKMKPPLREASHVQALIDGLKDGVIDVIATDHAPHHLDAKRVEFGEAAHGIVGLETVLPLALRLTQEGGVPLATVLRAMTINPARILGIEGGSLAPGKPADVTIVDPQRRWRVEPERLHSKGRNTPFAGWEMTGAATVTMVGGRVVWRIEETGSGNGGPAS